MDVNGQFVKYYEAGKKNRKKVVKLLEEYRKYKNNYVQNIQFDPELSNLSKCPTPRRV